MTAAVPQIPKIVTFSLAAQDFSEDVIDCAIVPTPGAIKKVVTLDGVVHQDTEPESWGLKVTAVAYYAYTHKGESVAFIYNAYGVGAESASAPKMTGICKLVAMPYGGPGNDFSTVDVTFPITGVPTRDATP
jgi:hypothetical protein